MNCGHGGEPGLRLHLQFCAKRVSLFGRVGGFAPMTPEQLWAPLAVPEASSTLDAPRQTLFDDLA